MEEKGADDGPPPEMKKPPETGKAQEIDKPPETRKSPEAGNPSRAAGKRPPGPQIPKKQTWEEGTAAKEDRSIMNVCFVMAPGKEALQDEFLNYAKERGMVGIKGHRSVGGFRASIYNACPVESVRALIACMQDFEKLHK